MFVTPGLEVKNLNGLNPTRALWLSGRESELEIGRSWIRPLLRGLEITVSRPSMSATEYRNSIFSQFL